MVDRHVANEHVADAIAHDSGPARIGDAEASQLSVAASVTAVPLAESRTGRFPVGAVGMRIEPSPTR